MGNSLNKNVKTMYTKVTGKDKGVTSKDKGVTSKDSGITYNEPTCSQCSKTKGTDNTSLHLFYVDEQDTPSLLCIDCYGIIQKKGRVKFTKPTHCKNCNKSTSVLNMRGPPGVALCSECVD